MCSRGVRVRLWLCACVANENGEGGGEHEGRLACCKSSRQTLGMFTTKFRQFRLLHIASHQKRCRFPPSEVYARGSKTPCRSYIMCNLLWRSKQLYTAQAVIGSVKNRKLRWFGHVARSSGLCKKYPARHNTRAKEIEKDNIRLQQQSESSRGLSVSEDCR